MTLNKMKLTKIFMLGTVLLYLAAFTSCVKDEVDDPPASGTDPALTVNKTIAGLKAMYNGNIMRIDSDWVIKGVVVGDDHSGNFYKSIVIQDETGGINIQIDQSSFYTTYKVGRNVFVKCRGLYLGDYHDLIQLGGYDDNGSVGRIPQSLVGRHLIPGAWNQPFDTKTVFNLENDLDLDIDQNKLVRLEGVHFAEPCTTWADIAQETSGNRDLIDAYGNIIIVRTSNFATFASSIISGDTGTVTGVFQVYDNDLQLVIRELSDVMMDPPNCAPPAGPNTSIAALRAMFTGSTGTIPANTIVEGIVISDKANNNITARNVVIEDATAGIVVRFTGNNTYNLGDKIVVDVSGQEISEYNGLLEANNVPNNKSSLSGTGFSITPRTATIADIMANGEAWESTLVKIFGVTITGGGTYAGNTTLTDATGTLPMFTYNSANFSSVSYPTGSVNVTGIISDFNGLQLNMRNTSDVQ